MDFQAGAWKPASTSFRHGLPESRLQGRTKITIPGTGYPLPCGYDGLLEHFVYNDESWKLETSKHVIPAWTAGIQATGTYKDYHPWHWIPASLRV